MDPLAADLLGGDVADPRTAQDHMQRALHRAVQQYLYSPVRSHLNLEGEILAEIEKAAALDPSSWMAQADLLWLYRRAHRPEDAARVLARVEDKPGSGFLMTQAVSALNDAGQYERALKVAASLPAPRDMLVELQLTCERLRSLAARGDLAGLLDAFSKEMRASSQSRQKMHILHHATLFARQLPRRELAKIEPAALEAELEKRMKEEPGEIAWPMGLAVLCQIRGDVDREIELMGKYPLDDHNVLFVALRSAWRILANLKEAPGVP